MHFYLKLTDFVYMRRQQICFVSYLDQDNLGVGYMASALLQCECFAITLVDIREDTPTIIESIIDCPLPFHRWWPLSKPSV